jgi:hypothetical protein
MALNCEVCETPVRAQSYLKTHIKRMHVKMEKMLDCKSCDKKKDTRYAKIILPSPSKYRVFLHHICHVTCLSGYISQERLGLQILHRCHIKPVPTKKKKKKKS